MLNPSMHLQAAAAAILHLHVNAATLRRLLYAHLFMCTDVFQRAKQALQALYKQPPNQPRLTHLHPSGAADATLCCRRAL